MAILSKRQFLIRFSIRNPSRYKHDLIPHRELSPLSTTSREVNRKIFSLTSHYFFDVCVAVHH